MIINSKIFKSANKKISKIYNAMSLDIDLKSFEINYIDNDQLCNIDIMVCVEHVNVKREVPSETIYSGYLSGLTIYFKDGHIIPILNSKYTRNSLIFYNSRLREYIVMTKHRHMSRQYNIC